MSDTLSTRSPNVVRRRLLSVSKPSSSKKPLGFFPPPGLSWAPRFTPSACSPLVMVLVPLRPAPSTTTTCDLDGVLEDVATAVIADECSLRCWLCRFFLVLDG